MSGLDQLLLSLAGAPSLPGARCRGKSHLFDGADGPDGERTRQAAQLCRRCPALARCRTWADEQPNRKLNGVIAARLYTHVSHASMRHHVNGMEIPQVTTTGHITAGQGGDRAIPAPNAPTTPC